MELFKKTKKNLELIKQRMQEDSDIKFREFRAKGLNVCVIFMDGMVDKAQINEFIIKSIEECPENVKLNIDNMVHSLVHCAECVTKENFEDLITSILGGNAVIIVDGEKRFIEAGVRKANMRAVAEPPTSQVIKGPREGFIENVKNNVALIRNRLKTEKLKVSYMECGKYTKTVIALCYVDGIADKKLFDGIKKRIEKIEIDAILDSSYITKFLELKPFSIFKQVGTTEKPDIVTAKLLEGRVAVIVDGSPIVLTLPYLLIEDFQSPEDYYERKYRVTFTRLIRLIAIFFAIILPAAYVAAQIFNLSIIPLRFSLTILNSTKGIPLSPAIEMLTVVLIFEILSEASIRMPKYVSMSLSIVGSLVLGQTAVTAGIISTPTLLIMALSALSLYSAPELVGTLSILRIVFIFLAGALGIFGIMLGVIFLASYVVSLESYGAPYFAPYAPIVAADLKDGIFKKELIEMQTRPKSFKQNNDIRLKMPKTPENK
ncbi:MAG: spore germination protein [Firmicutes bacterium]|nr:spore germination protein [Bacillota bacterium]